jgi:hypothetical protein
MKFERLVREKNASKFSRGAKIQGKYALAEGKVV